MLSRAGMFHFERRLRRRNRYRGEASEGGRSPPPSYLAGEKRQHLVIAGELELLHSFAAGALALRGLDAQDLVIGHRPRPGLAELVHDRRHRTLGLGGRARGPRAEDLQDVLDPRLGVETGPAD